MRSLLHRFGSRYATSGDFKDLAQSGWWTTLGTVLVSLATLLLYVVFARTLSPETFGTYQYLIAASGMLGALTLTGMNQAVTRAVARGKEGVLRRVVSIQLAWGLVPLAIALMGSAYYAYNENAVLAAGFAIMGVLVPFGNAYTTYAAYLAGKKDFKRVFAYNLAINLLFYGLVIACAILVPHAVLLLALALGTQALGCYLAYRVVIARFRVPDEPDPETVRYGAHLSLMGILGVVALQADAVLVFQMLGAAPLALYAFASGIPERIGGLFKFLPVALLPMLSARDQDAARRAFSWKHLGLVFAALLGVGVAYAMCAPLIFSILFPAYLAAVPYSQLYALGLVSVMGGMFSTALVASARVRALYAYNVVAPVITIAFVFVGIAYWGLWGAVCARILSAWVVTLASGWLLFRNAS